MVGQQSGRRQVVNWVDDAIELRVEVDESGVARLARLAARPVPSAFEAKMSPDEGALRGPGLEKAGPSEGQSLPAMPAAGLPLVDIITSGSGRAWSGRRYVESATGARLRYAGHEQRSDGVWHELAVSLEDKTTGLEVVVTYKVLEGLGAVRSWARLANHGASAVTVESVTSFLGSGLCGPGGSLDDVDVLWAENDWLSEGRWKSRALRDALPDLGREHQGADPRGCFALTSTGSWSSGRYLPMGAAVNRRSGHTWVWQVEHNGGWHWQVGEHTGRDPLSSAPGHKGDLPTGAYLAVLGPTDVEHHWRLVLRPGEWFESVPVGVVVSSGGFDEALARLTSYRRAVRRPHEDHRRLPVIFNDYMNTLMGDPTTERLRPLVKAAAEVGAEYFCIDSGWYNELGEGWWDTVGHWAPSKSRFPGGIGEVLDLIRGSGMVPGLWLEPEVVGVRSPVAAQLPAAAFFTRNGERVVEQGRYHLDFSHPAVVEHLDKVVDFLTDELGVGYLKMDYNIDVGPGTDGGGGSEGAGMLAHNRAFCKWVDGLLDRHPGLTLESCASGGMRTDYALLSRFQLQSTSDQQDFLRYPPIAAAAPAAIAPEQAAVWAYPQADWADNEIAFAMCGALLGRVHLSGHLDRMSPAQRQLVADALSVYKQVRTELAAASPFWPLDLPTWAAPWVALGMRGQRTTYVLVWYRGRVVEGPPVRDGAGPGKVTLAVAHLSGLPARAEVLYPVAQGAEVAWEAQRGELTVELPGAPSACLVALTTS
ncbi:MAG: alpha-galactosidase [Acidimicrobiales bacterium]